MMIIFKQTSVYNAGLFLLLSILKGSYLSVIERAAVQFWSWVLIQQVTLESRYRDSLDLHPPVITILGDTHTHCGSIMHI